MQKYEGIWYIESGMFPMQLIVTSRLSEEDNFWLRNLTNDFKDKSEADKMFEEYGKHADSKLHKSMMDLIMQANEGIFKEAKGNMCNALRELFKEEIDGARKDAREAGLAEGQLQLLKTQLKQGIISIADAAKYMNMSIDEFQAKLDNE